MSDCTGTREDNIGQPCLSKYDQKSCRELRDMISSRVRVVGQEPQLVIYGRAMDKIVSKVGVAAKG